MMASSKDPPPWTMGEVELPPTAAVAAQSNVEVAWSATPEEIDHEMIEKLKKRITYEIASAMTITLVMKETFNVFKVTDPKLIFVSLKGPTVIIHPPLISIKSPLTNSQVVGDSDGLGVGEIGRVQGPVTEKRWPWMMTTSLWRIVTVAAVKRDVQPWCVQSRPTEIKEPEERLGKMWASHAAGGRDGRLSWAVWVEVIVSPSGSRTSMPGLARHLL
jgi:hypothetical protein